MNTVNWGPLGREVYERTYSRPTADGQESWSETVARVVKGNVRLLDGHVGTVDSIAVPGEEIDALVDAMNSFSVLPAGRHLWASGAATTLGLFNCHRAGWTGRLSDHFTFTFDQLMLGGGVGANYSSEYLALSGVANTVTLDMHLDERHPDFEECADHLALHASVPMSDLDTFRVPDSREGWVQALQKVIDRHNTTPGATLRLDLSDIRPRGSAIVGFGGTASGPGPLAEMLVRVNGILNAAAGRSLVPLEAMAVDHAIASCVVAGNVRRSARMSILHWNDPFIFDFISCKADAADHWSTNISVEVDDAFFAALSVGEEHAERVLSAVAEGIYLNGEPGFFNSSLAAVGEHGDVRSTNPCGEIALEEWEQCCLGHVNLAHFADDHEGALEAFRLMARYLVRATFGKALDPRQEAVKARNRRIGVGFFGFHDWAVLNGVRYEDIPTSPELRRRLVEYREAVQEAAAEYAAELGIPVPVKTTTVAPTGSIAKLPGVSEGIQPPFSKYFIRRVRYSAQDPKLAGLAHLPQEPCVYTANTTVVSFTAHDPIMDRVAADLVQQSDEVSLGGYLDVQAVVQELFADNAVSITGNFDRNDVTVEELAALIRFKGNTVKGFTAMPEDGRPQSPYERLTADEYFATAERAGAFQAMDDCAGGACPIR